MTVLTWIVLLGLPLAVLATFGLAVAILVGVSLREHREAVPVRSRR